MSFQITREKYANLLGPTVGDKIRLGDTSLIIEIEKDYCTYGDEVVFGGGKTSREGMGQNTGALRDPKVSTKNITDAKTEFDRWGLSGMDEYKGKVVRRDQVVLDYCLLGATILDHWGIVKADIGIRDGRIVGIGKAGNPDVMDGVDPNLIIGASTECHNTKGFIVTAGGFDSHIHFICPQQVETSLYSGITTMGGGGTGPNDGTNATTITPGRWNMQRMLEAAEDFPMNIGYLAKGNCASPAAIEEGIAAGAFGLKIHEDWGTTPSAINASLIAADKLDVQVAIHTDTLNEAGFVEDTVKAFNGRVIHTFHTEGAGGGHAPDIIKVAMYPNVLPSSTNPTRPYTKNTVDEHMDMLMVCHHLSNKIPEDVKFADSRIRPETIAAEDILHDMGVFSMMSSDSQAMGRPGEVIARTWQTASKMRDQRGPLEEDKGHGNDNFRAKRYVAKYTINPAITHGISSYVGSVEKGKMADLVVWRPAFFGIKPEMVIKGGFVVASKMGDANASIPTPQPVIYRNMFGGVGRAMKTTAVNFVSQLSLRNGAIESYKLERDSLPVKNCRKVFKKDLIHNDKTPDIRVDHETYKVYVDGVLATCEPAAKLPLAQRYFLF